MKISQGKRLMGRVQEGSECRAPGCPLPVESRTVLALSSNNM